MSSMVRLALHLFPLAILASATPALAQTAPMADGSEWDAARIRNAALPRGPMTYAVERWKMLSEGGGGAGFNDYASFLLTYPGFPEEAKMRGWAEAALLRGGAEPARIVAFFDRFPPLTNPARAQYALALQSMGRPQARDIALAAWRGGAMTDAAEAALFASYASAITPADHDERMDALLWSGAAAAAQRQLPYVSAANRTSYYARVAMLTGQDPVASGIPPSPGDLADPGYVFNRVRQLKRAGASASAAQLLARRPKAAKLPRDPERWVTELLSTARGADPGTAVEIAASLDDSFAPGADISKMSFRLRDDYTSLMWLGGTKGMAALVDKRGAAALFERYGRAARTPYTRSKGFYWAGRAMARVGDQAGAARYFELAAQHADNFYGLLALERLGRPVPHFAGAPAGVISLDERTRFESKPLVAAVREVAKDFDWPTTVRFFREISDQAVSESDHLLVAELARNIGRRDLAVILGQSAHNDGFGDYQSIAFPRIPTPQGSDWTMVHAISRQESQFAMNAVSHAGARGLMQLMPRTAQEQANVMGLVYDSTALTRDAGYNLTLGDAYFGRMMDTFGGSYPLAVAAYNAGAGNVRKWLAANGDPRGGGIDWVEWIERIPLTETRNYVQRVLENAVVYDAMYPDKATYRGANPMSHYLGKATPG